ncbi:MAG: hypothetical protein RL358_47 [Pseudomonadota bacterium]
MNANFQIRKVAVLGAGVMGAQIAAHLVNANVQTILFDLPAKDGEPNGVVNKALEGLKKLDPAPISSPAKISYIEAANYEQHLEMLRDCDLIIEAIAERVDWKSDLYHKVAPHLNDHAIFATNTSGLSINTLAAAFPEAMRHRFCGIHFFNPPRYMHLVELIPCAGTDAPLLDQLETFLVSTLGKGVVRAKDTPNFIANRVGVFSMLATVHHAERLGLGFDIVDALTGRYLGRPKSATFRTLDVVGLDVFAHVVKTMQDNLADDPWHSYFKQPDWMTTLIAQGALGQKVKRGVYQKVGKEIQVLDLATQTYRVSDGKADDAVKDILRERDWAVKLGKLRDSSNPQAQFVWAMFRDVFHYCALQLEHIANNARDLDLAVRWGFGWDSGPFEIWQAAGWQQVSGWITADIAAGKTMSDAPLPAWVTEAGRSSVHTAQGSYAPVPQSNQARSTLPVYARQLYPDALLGEVRNFGETVFENAAVRMWHSGDSIAVLSFKTKMHTVDNDVLDGVLRAVDEAEAHFSALVLWQTELPFCAGANLLQLMQGVQEPAPDAGLFGKLKGAVSRVKYTVAGGGGMGDLFNAAIATPQIRARADHRSGGRLGVRRRLRILHPLHAHRCHAGKLHRLGRSGGRPIARRRRLQRDGTTCRSRGKRRRHLPVPAPLLPEHRHGRSRQECRDGTRDGLLARLRPHRAKPFRTAACRQSRSYRTHRHGLPSAVASSADPRRRSHRHRHL